MDDLNLVKEIIGLASSGGSLAVILVLWRIGFFKKNGNGEYKALSEQIETLKTNHFHEMGEKLDVLNKSLERIERSQEKCSDKLEAINTNLVFIRAKKQ